MLIYFLYRYTLVIQFILLKGEPYLLDYNVIYIMKIFLFYFNGLSNRFGLFYT